jgi:hypothetical protein
MSVLVASSRCFVPETKGRTLETIQHLWSEREPVAKAGKAPA